jgi:hypothetical protein
MSTDVLQNGRWVHRGAIVTSLLVGCLLVFTAVPRIAAHSAVLSAGTAIQALDEGRALQREEVVAAYEAYTEALSWHPEDPALLQDRARLAGRLALLDEQMAALWRERAVRDFRDALAAAPGDGAVWGRLAQAELEAGAGAEEVLGHLRLARLTAPRRASALLPQFVIVMRHWDAMPEEMRVHGLADVSGFWTRRAYRPLLVSTYLEAGFEARAAFRERLGERPSALQQFDRQLASSFSR